MTVDSQAPAPSQPPTGTCAQASSLARLGGDAASLFVVAPLALTGAVVLMLVAAFLVFGQHLRSTLTACRIQPL